MEAVLAYLSEWKAPPWFYIIKIILSFFKKKKKTTTNIPKKLCCIMFLIFVAVCDQFLDVDNTCILSCKRVNEVLTPTVFKEGLVMNLCCLIALDLDIQVYTYQIPILYLNKTNMPDSRNNRVSCLKSKHPCLVVYVLRIHKMCSINFQFFFFLEDKGLVQIKNIYTWYREF